MEQEDAKTRREADVGYEWVEVNVWEGEVLPSVDRNAVCGAGTGGLMTSRCSFLFAHRKTPEEQERRRWRKDKTSGRVTAGVSEQTQTCLTVRERERSREGGMERWRRARKWGSDELNLTVMITELL